ncbi:MAG: diadenylate cyclase, partial [Bacteroidota bacterium]
KFLLLVGSTGFFPKVFSSEGLFKLSDVRKKNDLDLVSIVKACKVMSQSKTGAIIVLARQSNLSFYYNTGESIHATVSQRLIESIFYKNSPLHDGAIIIENNEIIAARCVLPISENSNFPANLGMRHRAALGITESTDAIAIAVSEQTGEIALAKENNLELHLTPDTLRTRLEQVWKN